MNRIEDVEIELGDSSTIVEVRTALQQQRNAIQRAFEDFGRGGDPFGVALTRSGIGNAGNGAQSACDVLRELLASLEYKPKNLYSVGAQWVLERGSTRVKLILTQQLPDSKPAGVLLLERTFRSSIKSPGSDATLLNIRGTLEDHVMAHSDSEYAVEVEVPGHSIADSCELLDQGLEYARAVIAVMPADVANPPNIHELRVRLNRRDGATQVRIWRMGFMKVPGRSRMA